MTRFRFRRTNIRNPHTAPARGGLDARLPDVPTYPLIPAQRRPRTPGAARAFLLIFLVGVIDLDALVAGLADVTDRGAAKDGEIERRLKVEVSAPAENTLFKLGGVRAGVFREDEAAAAALEIAFRPFELKAVSRVADGAGDEYFLLDS